MINNKLYTLIFYGEEYVEQQRFVVRYIGKLILPLNKNSFLYVEGKLNEDNKAVL